MSAVTPPTSDDETYRGDEMYRDDEDEEDECEFPPLPINFSLRFLFGTRTAKHSAISISPTREPEEVIERLEEKEYVRKKRLWQ